ncbi:HAD-IIB family hydrolase [Pectinatus frisingensis]|uniref:HAD-IIB family hydrolase n=1 Tax=Pectinatus frisingensis TaxID=865 RepID=UPI0018C69311|nr:HAD-IIB family hydrolase [Pectinatus frisingensis]
MKIAASDFDGTLYRKNQKVTMENLAAIAHWRAAGNLFGIATGRGLVLILQRIYEYNIPFDFLVCTNGAAVFDDKLNILANHILPTQIQQDLLSQKMVEHCQYVIFFTTKKAYLYPIYNEICIDSANLNIPKITLQEAFRLSGLIQITLFYPDAEETAVAQSILQNHYSGSLYISSNQCFVDITACGVDKATGLQELLQEQHWNHMPLLTIGDDKNDLPMIERFQGYTVESAADLIKKTAVKVYPSVGDLLLDHLTS